MAGGEPQLFVGALPADCDEATLHEYFCSFGEIRRVELQLDPVTHMSRGTAIVTMASQEGCDAALALSNVHDLNGAWIEVKAVDRPSPSSAPHFAGGKNGGKGGGKLALTQHGGCYGAAGPKGGFKGRDPSAGSTMHFSGKPKHEFNPAKIFVGGLPRTRTPEEVPLLQDEIYQYFNQFGTVAHVELKTDAPTGGPGLSRGFCFVTFEDEASATAVMNVYDTHQIRGKWVEVKQANADGQPSGGSAGGKGSVVMPPRPAVHQGFNGKGWAGPGRSDWGGMSNGCAGGKPSSAPSSGFDSLKVFVGHLPKDCSEEMFASFASQFGEVSEALVMKDLSTNLPRGFGFIKFVSPDSVDAILANHAENTIGGRWVDVKPATREGSKGSSAPYASQAGYGGFKGKGFMGPMGGMGSMGMGCMGGMGGMGCGMGGMGAMGFSKGFNKGFQGYQGFQGGKGGPRFQPY